MHPLQKQQQRDDIFFCFLYFQSVQSVPVSNPVTQNPPAATHSSTSLNPDTMPPSSHVTGTSHPPASEVAYRNAPGVAWQDDRTQIQQVVAEHHQPYTTRESPHDSKDPHSYSGSRPAFGMLSLETCSPVELFSDNSTSIKI